MNLDYKHTFICWYYNEFCNTTLFEHMADTSEDNPWHMERNVGVHTNMVVSVYLGNTNVNWSKDDLLGGLALAFHDVGKPATKVKKNKPERGDYFAFHGHEQKSARLWENFAVCYWDHLVGLFNLTPDDIFKVGWMIEYHLPWGITNKDKRDRLLSTVSLILDDPKVYMNVLMADTYGRISADSFKNEKASLEWCNTFCRDLNCHPPIATRPSEHQPILTMTIAASGSGKSTYVSNNENTSYFSLDSLRHEFYSDDYEKAYEMSVEDKDFFNKANARFIEMIKTGKSLTIDNTNVTKKVRNFYIVEAKKRGYFIEAILFPIEYETIVTRQTSRLDKTVPKYAVERQYNSIQLPSYGEFNSIIVCPVQSST